MAEPGVSVVLGGTRGIGAAVARRLAAPGETLVLNHLQDQAAADDLARELRRAGAEVVIVTGNIAEPTTRQAVAAAVEASGRPCRRLVHSTAVTSFKALADTRANQWDLVLAVSARSLLDVVRILRRPLEQAQGAVVAVSSQGATRHVPNYGALGPAKAALEATVRQLAAELAPHGIRVNAVRAGLVAGDVVDRFPTEVVAGILARTPLARLGKADEIATVVEFLLGDGAAWVTGQVVEVDGGFAIT